MRTTYADTTKDKTSFSLSSTSTFRLLGLLTDDGGRFLLNFGIGKKQSDYAGIPKNTSQYADSNKNATSFSNRIVNETAYLLDLLWEDDGLILLDYGENKKKVSFNQVVKQYTTFSEQNKNKANYSKGIPSNVQLAIEDDLLILEDGSYLMVGIADNKKSVSYAKVAKQTASFTGIAKTQDDYRVNNISAITLDSMDITLDDLTVRLHGYLTVSPPSSIDSKNKTMYEAV